MTWGNGSKSPLADWQLLWCTPRLQESLLGSGQDEEKVLLVSGPCLPKTQTGYTQVLITLGMSVYPCWVIWLWFHFPDLLFSAQQPTIKCIRKERLKNICQTHSLHKFSYIHRNGLPFSRWVNPFSTSSVSSAMLAIDGNSKDDIKK